MQQLQVAIQSVLSRIIVFIGHHYADLGPRAENGSIALARIFENIPVLGKNGLGDMLQGLRLHLGAPVFKGEIPTTVWLANPFSCGIGVHFVDLRVFAEPNSDSTFLGWVSLLKSPKVDNDSSPRQIEFMPPYNNVQFTDAFYFGNSSVSGLNDSFTLMKNEPPRYLFKLNLGNLVLDSKEAIQQLTA